ncbi:MAG: metallophosphoesterase [Deltaproteobacteria bacterium]|nr:metallophosphoesterase [Deltaproteobacteria bacterium]
MSVRIAHYSDVHVTLDPLRLMTRAFAGKRVMGTLNYYFGNRRAHFREVEQRIQTLLEDIDTQNVDHAICTGDLTAMSFQEEMSRAAELFGDRRNQPARHTVLPGNHDRYTQATDEGRLFEQFFASLSSPEGTFPYTKRIAPQVSLVVLDVCRATSLFDSSGRVGEAQLAATTRLLSSPELANDFVIVALHYALLRKNGQRDRRSHGIEDDVALLELLSSPSSRVDLVIHGHVHEAYTLLDRHAPIVCAGSATDLHQRCGYNVYTIDLGSRHVDLERREYRSDKYEPATTVRLK